MTLRPFRFSSPITVATSRAELRDQVRKLEDFGYSTATMSDHIDEQLGPIASLMAIAEASSTLRIAPLVFSNDFRHPVVLAKEAATLDLLSDGRLEFGLGAGWRDTDYAQCRHRPRPRRCPHRPHGRGARGGEGPVGRRAVHPRGRALPRLGPRRHAQALPAAPPADHRRRRGPKGARARRRGRPTSSASTRACPRGGSMPSAGPSSTPSATDQKLEWVRRGGRRTVRRARAARAARAVDRRRRSRAAVRGARAARSG